jgi:hypothetical protein
MVRVGVHKQQIRDPSMRQISLSNILISAETENSVIIPFYKWKKDDPKYRGKMEKFFIKLFESKLNRKELCCPEKTPETPEE